MCGRHEQDALLRFGGASREPARRSSPGTPPGFPPHGSPTRQRGFQPNDSNLAGASGLYAEFRPNHFRAGEENGSMNSIPEPAPPTTSYPGSCPPKGARRFWTLPPEKPRETPRFSSSRKIFFPAVKAGAQLPARQCFATNFKTRNRPRRGYATKDFRAQRGSGAQRYI